MADNHDDEEDRYIADLLARWPWLTPVAIGIVTFVALSLIQEVLW